jgi:AcrR family transcriptional regulator
VTRRSSRQTLFREAVRLISERGYHETTVGDIEEAAGLTRRAGGFYRHFASKDEVLLEAIERMSAEMIAEIRLEEVAALQSPRAELLVIAQALTRHAERYRSLRRLIQREGHKVPALRGAAKRANRRIAALDVVPWVKSVLQRSKITGMNAREVGLMMFGPILIYIYSSDRDDPAFGMTKIDAFLSTWADHWGTWLSSGQRHPRNKRIAVK